MRFYMQKDFRIDLSSPQNKIFFITLFIAIPIAAIIYLLVKTRKDRNRMLTVLSLLLPPVGIAAGLVHLAKEQEDKGTLYLMLGLLTMMAVASLVVLYAWYCHEAGVPLPKEIFGMDFAYLFSV